MLVLLQKVQLQQLTAAVVNNINAEGTKIICNGTANEAMDTAYDKQNKLHHSHSLVSIKLTKQPDHTQELGDGVTAKFVSFNLDDHDDDDDNHTNNESKSQSPGGTIRRPSENDLRNAPKDDWGIQYIPVN